MMLKFLNKQLFASVVSLISIIILFELTNLDWFVQDFFYNFTQQEWLLDKNNGVLKFIFYIGIKKVLIIFGVAILISVIFLRKTSIVQKYQRGLILVFISLLIIPAVVAGLKAISNTPCPKSIERYNGSYPNVKVFDNYPKSFKQKHKIRCWPAGHASGGFALLSLFFLFKTPKNKKRALIFAIFIGWSMGLYKMFIGDHFLSHTIISMILAWIIVLILNLSLQRLR